jgi:hypothetical protein
MDLGLYLKPSVLEKNRIKWKVPIEEEIGQFEDKATHFLLHHYGITKALEENALPGFFILGDNRHLFLKDLPKLILSYCIPYSINVKG